MQPGEVVVARLGKGATIVRALAETDTQVSVAVGRNRQARIPRDRVILETGVTVSDDEKLEEFRRRSQELSASIDLTEVWDVVADEGLPLSVDELAELYWEGPGGAGHRAAMALRVDMSSDRFEYAKGGYTPRSRSTVAELQARRRREAEHAEEAASLMRGLADGEVPAQSTPHQSTLVEHLRGYAVHGDDYSRAGTAKDLLKTVAEDRGDLQRLGFDLLVLAGIFSPDEPLELHRAGIRTRFPDDVLAEANEIIAARTGESGRRDLTALPTITIDDAEAEDRDDALSLLEESGESGLHIGVHVADASALIPGGGPIDREADRRMATLYLPERKIGMLPQELVSRSGSIDPGETRIAMSLLVRIDASGEVADWEVTPSVVRSRAALAYEEADQALSDPDDPWHGMLAHLAEAARALRHRRESAGAVEVERSELSVKVRPAGQVEVSVRTSTPAQQLVAELMILCNSLLAEFCRREKLPAAYRTQSMPDLSDILGESNGGQKLPDGPLGRYLVMRRLPPAGLDLVPAPHGGLGVKAYIQATSPLRRYPDLVMQRQISHFLGSGKPLYEPETIASVAQRADVQLRELAHIEEDRKRYWFLKYLQQSLLAGSDSPDSKNLLPAVVLENQPNRRALLELSDYPFRLRTEVPQGRAPGDTVTLKLHGVDLWRRLAQFVHLDESP